MVYVDTATWRVVEPGWDGWRDSPTGVKPLEDLTHAQLMALVGSLMVRVEALESRR